MNLSQSTLVTIGHLENPFQISSRIDERVATRRLVDRLGLGARRVDVDDGVGRGVESVLENLLVPGPGDQGRAATPPPTFAPLEVFADDDPRKALREAELGRQLNAAKLWWLDRMSRVEHPLAEKMAWVWHGHFATSEEKVRDPALMLAQNETLRALGTGGFRDLVRAMVIDPALVVWLDGQANRRGAPNENLGRELMELFTLGVGHYTETDVRESARALTGWTYSDRQLAFSPAEHDDMSQTVLGTRAAYDAGSLVDLLVAQPESARFVVSRLWARLVSSVAPTEDELSRLTDAYGPGCDILALLRAMVTTAAFRHPASTLVKQPVEWLVGLARAVGQPIGALPDEQSFLLLVRLQLMGQLPFRPPNVGGWPAGAPWLTPSATVHRLGAATTLLASVPVPDAPRGVNARLEWARAVLAVDVWSSRTRDALSGSAAGDPRELLAAASASPEYVVSC